MSKPDCDVCNGLEIYGELPWIVESDIWRVELNPNQQHLGRTFVGLREHKSSLSELSETELLEFHRILKKLEIGARAAFGTSLFNWMCLMNNAVRDHQEPHVHWHMVPRYPVATEFYGRQYTDSAWPRQYNTGIDPPYYPAVDELEAIAVAFRHGISVR